MFYIYEGFFPHIMIYTDGHASNVIKQIPVSDEQYDTSARPHLIYHIYIKCMSMWDVRMNVPVLLLTNNDFYLNG